MQIYKVGGAVRDELLGYPHHETDWVVVGGTPEAMLDAGYSQVGKDFPVFLHPQTKEEYALARTERKSGHGYHGFTVHADPSVTLEQDLGRRDLTINAMAMTDAGEIIDPYGGQADLASKTLRHVSPHFVEDPLRVLRVARFAARYAHLGFHIAPETLQLMTDIVSQGELVHLSIERVWVETERALAESTPEVYFQALTDVGAMAQLAPAVLVTNGLQRLQQARQHSHRTLVRWAALLCELPPARAQQTCTTLKSPKAYRELSMKVCEWRPQVKVALRDPSQCMALLQGLDALRRDEPFGDFCKTLAALEPLTSLTTPEPLDTPLPPADTVEPKRVELSTNPAVARLLAARAVAGSISAADLAAEGLSGPALGAAINERRTQAIAQLFNDTTSTIGHHAAHA